MQRLWPAHIIGGPWRDVIQIAELSPTDGPGRE